MPTNWTPGLPQKDLGGDAAAGARRRDRRARRRPGWSAGAIEEALKAALLDGLQLKPRKAFGPIRVAVTGSTVSPPLFESLELLGRERSLRRLRAARERAGVAE